MSTAIKKTSKRIWYSLIFFGATGMALLLGFFVGGNNSNLSRLDSKAKEVFNNNSNLIFPAARADTPPPAGSDGCGSSGGGCGSDGGCGEGCGEGGGSGDGSG